MEAKEKAIELVRNHYNNVFVDCMGNLWESAKNSAKVTVVEILKLDIYASDEYYWQEVKQEIEKL